jgi:outer membrane biosynthesis protein TonB
MAASAALHLAMLMLLFGERAVPLVIPEQRLEVRVIDDPRGLAAGAPTDDRRPHASSIPSSVAAPTRSVPAPAKGASSQAKRSDATPVIAARLPRPAIERPHFDARGALASNLSPRGDASGGDAGSGRHGSDLAGSMRRIAFVTAVRPALDARTKREAHDAYAIVAARIDIDGRPHDLRFLRTTGHASLDKAIRIAVNRSRYRPHVENGKPVEFWAIIPYVFGDAQPDISGALASAGFEHT